MYLYGCTVRLYEPGILYVPQKSLTESGFEPMATQAGIIYKPGLIFLCRDPDRGENVTVRKGKIRIDKAWMDENGITTDTILYMTAHRDGVVFGVSPILFRP